MKIETVIPLRTDGTLKIKTASGNAVVFKLDDRGHVVADVESEVDITWLLSMGDFFPADPDDFQRAESMVLPAGPVELDEDESGDEVMAPPVEIPAEAIPAPTKKKK